MDFLARSPQIVHTPVALIITGAVFELIGRTIDLGVVAQGGVRHADPGNAGRRPRRALGRAASERAEKGKGCPSRRWMRTRISASWTWWIAAAAVLARMLAGRLKVARGPAAGLALMLHLAAAVTVAMAAHRGGVLVYEHAAGCDSTGSRPLGPSPSRIASGRTRATPVAGLLLLGRVGRRSLPCFSRCRFSTSRCPWGPNSRAHRSAQGSRKRHLLSKARAPGRHEKK